MPRVLTRQGDVRKELEDILAPLEANAADLPQLEVHRLAIVDVLQDIRSFTADQDIFRANKQQTSKRLRAAIDKGRKLLTVARVVLKQHYGSDNEKLLEFGVQPFRGRSRAQTPAPETPEDKPQDRLKAKPSEPES
ncbi:MAG TPA: hypothetical protein VEL74_08580 [Thermoanaerobaculia bacterium]|nr:hypothetical protein [Thermoanaerobaculia bacterium]